MPAIGQSSCDTCGTWTLLDVHCCGRCATDSNDPDRAAGRRRINGRRQVNGLAPLTEPADIAGELSSDT